MRRQFEAGGMYTESNEFIINTFKYANKYAPSDVELYYNDFGETDNIKSEGITKLISDVKSSTGNTT